MKICLLGYNGSVHVQKWIKALSQQNSIDLHVITYRKGLEYSNVKYYYLKSYTRTKLDYLLNIFHFKKLIKRISPDILHSHYATSYGFLGALSDFHPYIITAWGADIFDSPKQWIIKKILKYSLQKADAITVLSQISSVEISKYTDKNILLIPFGVDINKFYKSSTEENEIIKIGTIRTLNEKYGVEFLLRAFALLSSKYNNIQLEIVGEGEQKEFLIGLAKELEIDHRTVFHGFISQNTNFDQYIRILRSFDIFTILSIMDSETFGVAAVEASACSIPVIASDVGGLPEVIIKNKTGLVIPKKDISQIAAAVEELLLNKQKRLELGNNGRKRVEEFYSWDKNINQMLNLYEQLINN